MINQCIAVVMAAGESKRFGERKLYRRLGDKPVIYHVLDALKAVDLKDVLVVVQPGDTLDTTFTLLENPNYSSGQSSSIRRAMAHDSTWEGAFFCPADQPFVNPEIMRAMADVLQEGVIVVPRFQGRNGSPVLFSHTFREELSQLQGEEGGRPIIRRHPESLVFFELPSEEMFLDIDTVEDLIEARARVTKSSRRDPSDCDKVKP